MKLDHVCIMVRSMDEALALWIDVLGFNLLMRITMPDGESAGPGVLITQKVLDDIFRVKGAKSDTALLASNDGAIMELQQVIVPEMVVTPKEERESYAHTGIHEVGLLVEDIDHWFDKIRAAGYETQTDYVWEVDQFGRNFIFYDADGNLIQLRQLPVAA